MLKAKPFVKWAGGKRSIVDKLIKYSPSEFINFIKVRIITPYFQPDF